MIDWTSGKITLAHDPKLLRCGSVVSVDPDGIGEWETRKRTVVEGSFSNKFTVRSEDLITEDHATSLSFSGNPVTFLQGHNIFGTSDLTGLIYEAILKCLKALNIPIAPIELEFLFKGAYPLSRVDINYMYSMGSRSNVMAWLYAAEHSARTRQGKGVFSGTTLYYQKKSTRWSLKFYSKGAEIAVPGHQLPNEFVLGDSLTKFADDKLRCELTLRTKELKKLALDKGSSWGDNEPYSIYETYMSKLDMSEQKNTDALLIDLPNVLRGTYTLWKDGHDVKGLLAKPTFYRHRKQLLEHGVDISIKSSGKPNNVIPLMRIIEAVPCDVPEWAEGTTLYFEPRKAL